MAEYRSFFGTVPDGIAEVCRLTSSGAEVEISTLGATLVSVRIPDRAGQWADVALGFEDPNHYLTRSGCLGATIGRYAGRIGHGRFPLNGSMVTLEKNRGDHTIHGGPEGFHRQLWEILSQTENHLELGLHSPDGDQGFPGAMEVRVVYTLTENSLKLEYHARSTVDTVCSMTNHVYWNLAGHDSGTIDGHRITVPAETCLETDGETIPTGCFLPLAGTPLDLRTMRPMEQVHADHTFLLPDAGLLHLAGRVEEPISGRWMEVWTDYPAVQVFTADRMAESGGKNGAQYGPRRGFCLEAQHCPDAPNHPNFPSALLLAEEDFYHEIVWRFGIE